MSKNLSKTFDIEPQAVQQLPVAFGGAEEIDTDAEFARANMKQLIETSKSALQNMLEVAIQSESPRAYEIVANLLNTAAELNKGLLATHETQQKVERNKPGTEDAKVVTNNSIIFSGTTNELQELIMKKMKGNE